MLVSTTHPAARSTTGPATIAVELALRGDWRDVLRLDPMSRTFTRLDETDDWEAWVLGWWPGQGTGVHDHGGVSGAIVVVQGTLLERSWPSARPGREPVDQLLRPGQVRTFGGSLVHDVSNQGDQPAVSLHVYSPRLTAMTRYLEDLTPVGVERAQVDW